MPKYNPNIHYRHSIRLKSYNYSQYEHIIKNAKSYQTISNYIINNPLQWETDKFNLSNNVGAYAIRPINERQIIEI
ncbi:MAG: hypothetical protein LBH22_03225 [Bacteroidales bacterium]|nr:hypothetical protein [Bacteroidales bacterium]